MWEYQWTTHFTLLTQELSDLIYEESQGILDIAIKLFMLAQIKAISTGDEKLSNQIFKQVAKESLKLVQPMLNALRSGIPSEIAKYEDIRPIDMDEEIERYKASINIQEQIRIQKKIQEQKNKKREQSLIEEITLQILAMDFDPKDVQKAIEKVFQIYGTDNDKSLIVKEVVKLLIANDVKQEEKAIKKKNYRPTEEKYLVNLMKDAKRNKKSVYQWLLEKNIIKNPLKEFGEDNDNVNLVSNAVS